MICLVFRVTICCTIGPYEADWINWRARDEQGINMLDAGAFVTDPGRPAVCCVEVDAGLLGAAEKLLCEKGFHVIADKELLAL